MDAHLKGSIAGERFLDEGLAQTFARRGIDLDVAPPVHTGYVAGVM
jgi:hypothetical protein